MDAEKLIDIANVAQEHRYGCIGCAIPHYFEAGRYFGDDLIAQQHSPIVKDVDLASLALSEAVVILDAQGMDLVCE